MNTFNKLLVEVRLCLLTGSVIPVVGWIYNAAQGKRITQDEFDTLMNEVDSVRSKLKKIKWINRNM